MQKNVVGAKLAWKQPCKNYLRRDENMECTLGRGGTGKLEQRNCP